MQNNGRLLLGTFTDSGYTLDVNGTGRFSGNVTVGSSSTSIGGLLVIGGSSIGTANANNGQIYIGATSGYRGVISYDEGPGYLYIDNTYNNNSGNIYFRTKTAGTAINALTIAGTGAATFSSSVTSTSIISDGGANEGAIRIERDTVGTSTIIGSLNFTNNNGATIYGKVFAGRNSAGDGYVALGTGVSNNLYALESGNVGIGTNTPSASSMLTLSTASNFGLQLSNTGTGGVSWQIGATSNDFGSGGGKLIFTYGNASLNSVLTLVQSTSNVLIGTTTDNGYRLNVSGRINISGSHPSGFGMLNMVSSDPCIISLDSTTSYDVRVRFKYQGVDKWFAGMASNTDWELQSATIAAIKVNQSGDVFLYDRLAVGTGSFSGSAKLLVGTVLTIGSSAVAQFNGFVRIKDQVIIHNNALTAETYLQCTGSNALTTGGSITATSFFESSDATIKTLITDNYQAKGIESVVAKLYVKNGKEELGYYAQDVQGILPSAVSKGEDGLLSLSYREVLVAKVQRTETEIDKLKRRVVELEQQLNLN
jgi:hypothetical protein